MNPLSLPSTSESSSGENPLPDTSYPLDGSNERIARLRSELLGVRTGIRRLVSGLRDLNETTHQQELAAEASLPSFSMSTGSAERSSQRMSRPAFQGNLEASAWSNIANPPRFHNPPVTRNPQRLEPAGPRPDGQDRLLRIRQRAYLESDQQHHQATAPVNTSNDQTARNAQRRPLRENPFQVLGTRQDVERPDYQSSVPNMYGNAWGEYRNAEAARQAQIAGASNVPSAIESRSPMMLNPLLNPPAMPQYLPPFLTHPNTNGQQRQLDPLGLQPVATTAFNPQTGFQLRDVPGLSPPHSSSDHPGMAYSHRRQQNMTAPDRSAGHSESSSFVRRTSHANRRATNRGESEGSTMGGPIELPGVDMLPPRMGYPYILPGGISREHYLAEFHARGGGSETDSEPSLTFDTQDRPPPMDADSMKLDMSCSICREHLVDTVVLPCGHAVMCNWCADLHVPSRKHDRSIPKDRSAKCPMCRSRIKQKVSSTRSHSVVLMTG
jgi:Zinc finger, C3HC4 type (RING finger)